LWAPPWGALMSDQKIQPHSAAEEKIDQPPTDWSAKTKAFSEVMKNDALNVHQPRTNWCNKIKALLGHTVERVLMPALEEARADEDADTINSRNAGGSFLQATYADDRPYLPFLFTKLDQLDDPGFSEALFHALKLVHETMAYGYIPGTATHRIDAANSAHARQHKTMKIEARDAFVRKTLPAISGSTSCRLTNLNEQLKAAGFKPIKKSTLYEKFPDLLELEKK
jgi:hypothetical protein